MTLQSIFSNREIASFVWTVILLLLVFCTRSKDKTSNLLKQTGRFLRSIIVWRIQAIIIWSIAYVFLIIYVLEQLGFWNLNMLKDSTYWLLGSAFIIILNIRDNLTGERFFTKLFKQNIKFLVILEFLVNVKQFGFLWELLFIPFVFLVVMTNQTAKVKEPQSPVIPVLDWIEALIGVVLLTLTIVDIVLHPDVFFQISILKDFMLPIILTIAFLPCAYLVALIMRYEILFQRISWCAINKNEARYGKLRLLIIGNVRLKKLSKIGRHFSGLHKATKEDFRRVIV